MRGAKPKKCSECHYFHDDVCEKRNESRVSLDEPCNKGRYDYLSALVNGGLQNEDKRTGDRV